MLIHNPTYEQLLLIGDEYITLETVYGYLYIDVRISYLEPYNLSLQYRDCHGIVSMPIFDIQIIDYYINGRYRPSYVELFKYSKKNVDICLQNSIWLCDKTVFVINSTSIWYMNKDTEPQQDFVQISDIRFIGECPSDNILKLASNANLDCAEDWWKSHVNS